MARTAIIIPVYNRREITLRCLAGLAQTGVLEWAQAVVVDDGSTDGTGDAIRREFPAARVLTGGGDLWWGGAIRLGMDAALEDGAEILVWLNDDCLPAPGTLRVLVDHAARTGAVAAGWAVTPSDGRYGGYRRTRQGLATVDPPPPGGAVSCDAAAGNCVAIPRAVVAAIGLPDNAHLPHVLLDADYLLDATAGGFRVDLLGSAVCHNDDNRKAASSSWLLSDRSPLAQWKIFLTPQSCFNYRVNLHFSWKHWRWRGLWLYARSYLKLAAICGVRAVVPLAVLRRWFGQRSAAFQREQFYREENRLPGGR